MDANKLTRGLTIASAAINLLLCMNHSETDLVRRVRQQCSDNHGFDPSDDEVKEILDDLSRVGVVIVVDHPSVDAKLYSTNKGEQNLTRNLNALRLYWATPEKSQWEDSVPPGHVASYFVELKKEPTPPESADNRPYSAVMLDELVRIYGPHEIVRLVLAAKNLRVTFSENPPL